MKTKTLFLFFLMALIKTPVIAFADNSSDTLINVSGQSGLNLCMPYPEEAFQDGTEGFVLVEMSRNTSGNYVITQVNGSDADLIEGVVKFLTHYPIESNCDTFALRFDFEIL